MNSITFKFNMESFYFSTHLPIKGISLLGDQLYSVGHNENTSQFFKKVDINNIIKTINSDNIKSPIDFSPIEDIYFSICPIESTSYNQGFYLVGPYTTNVSIKYDVIFKPKHCINYLLNILYIKSDPKADEVHKTNYNFNVNKAIKYIEDNYNKSINLDALCSTININKSYFCTIFKEHTGKTFSRYLSHYRIKKSKELLKTTDLSITDIALSVGFNSVNYFNNNFKRLTDMTPAQYRNKHHSEQNI